MDAMSKADMASYLVSLHNLMEAQMKSAHSKVNAGLAWEYERIWDALTAQIKKEKEDETRKSEQQRTGGPQGGAGGSLPESGSGSGTGGERRSESRAD